MTQALNNSHAARLGRRQMHVPSGNLSAAVFFALIGLAAIDLVDRWHLAQGELAAEVLAHRFILGWIIVGAAAVVWAVLKFRHRELAVVTPDSTESADGDVSRGSGHNQKHAVHADCRSQHATGHSNAMHAAHVNSSHHHGANSHLGGRHAGEVGVGSKSS